MNNATSEDISWCWLKKEGHFLTLRAHFQVKIKEHVKTRTVFTKAEHKRIKK